MLIKTDIDTEEIQDVKNIFIVCPNFEERSIGFLDSIKHFNSSNLAFFITKLKGANPQELLDEIKDENTKKIIEYLKLENIKYEYQKFQYPIRDLKQYINEIVSFAKSISSECNLFIDISSMPRNMIFRFLDHLFLHFQNDYTQIDEIVIKAIYISYTPAVSYPSTGNIDHIGGVKGIYKNKPFHRLIREYEEVNLIMFLAGNSHDTSQVYSQSYEDGVNSTITRHMLVYLNRDNLIHSYKKIGENHRILNLAMTRNDKIIYFYDVEHMASLIYDIVNEISVLSKRFTSSFLGVGAFGTKTICLSSYLAKKRFELLNSENSKFQSDVLTNDIGQYVSIYSIGKKNTEFYKIDLLKLNNMQLNNSGL